MQLYQAMFENHSMWEHVNRQDLSDYDPVFKLYGKFNRQVFRLRRDLPSDMNAAII